MNKYFIGSGYFHEDKWVNGINMPTSAPTSSDDIIIDNRCSEIKFEFKTRLHKLIYNIRIAFKCWSFRYWNKIVYQNMKLNTSGTVIIGRPMKSSTVTYETGTITVTKSLTAKEFQ